MNPSFASFRVAEYGNTARNMGFPSSSTGAKVAGIDKRRIWAAMDLNVACMRGCMICASRLFLEIRRCSCLASAVSLCS